MLTNKLKVLTTSYKPFLDSAGRSIRMVGAYTLLACLVLQLGSFAYYKISMYWLTTEEAVVDNKYLIIFIIFNAVAAWIMIPKPEEVLKIDTSAPVDGYLEVSAAPSGKYDKYYKQAKEIQERARIAALKENNSTSTYDPYIAVAKEKYNLSDDDLDLLEIL